MLNTNKDSIECTIIIVQTHTDRKLEFYSFTKVLELNNLFKGTLYIGYTLMVYTVQHINTVYYIHTSLKGIVSNLFAFLYITKINSYIYIS